MNSGAPVNWIAAFNQLFPVLNRSGAPVYCSGADLCRVLQQVDPGSPSYDQLIPLLTSQGRSTSRKSFYWEMLQALPEPQRLHAYRIFIDRIEPHAQVDAETLRGIVFGGGYAVPVTLVPVDLWNSDKLNSNLRNIGLAIDAAHYNRATTLVTPA